MIIAKKQVTNLFPVFAAGLIFLLVLRDIAGLDISKFIYLAYIMVFLALAKNSDFIDMLCFLLPLLWGLPGTYIILGAVVLYVFKRERYLRGKVVIAVLFFLALEMIAMIFYPTQPRAADIVHYICTLALFFLLIQDKDKNINYESAIRKYLYGATVLGLIVLIATFQDVNENWMEVFARGFFRLGKTRDDGSGRMLVSLNANALAYQSIIAITLAFILMKKASRRGKILLVLFSIFHFVTGILSLSRTWVIVVVLLALILLFSPRKNIKSVAATLALTVLAVAAAYWYFQKNPYLWEGFMSRFTDDNMETGGGRTEIFMQYMQAFSSNIRLWFIGAGTTQYRSAMSMVYATHNATQQILVCYGIPGFVIFMYMMLSPVFKMGKKRILYWLPFIGAVMFVQANQFIWPCTLMLQYIPAFFALKLGENNFKA